MKKSILSIVLLFTIFSCTDVVDIPLKESVPKIVIEALLNWQKGTSGNLQTIKLKTTSSYYNNVSPTVSGATVTVTNSSDTVFAFAENVGTGEYVCTNFVPVLNETYRLKIISNGKTYTATETLKPVASILDVTQEAIAGTNDGKGKTIKASFVDPEATQDYYLYKYETPYDTKITNIYVLDDEFFNGNDFFSEASQEKLKTNDNVKVTHFGISRAYFEYMNKLISVATSGGGLFSAPPVTVRGNITNVTNNDDFPFGFFALSETDVRNYTVQ